MTAPGQIWDTALYHTCSILSGRTAEVVCSLQGSMVFPFGHNACPRV